jgi:hypothetical protein
MSQYNNNLNPSSTKLEDGNTRSIEQYNDILDVLRPENKEWLLSSNVLTSDESAFSLLLERAITDLLPLKQKTDHLASQIQKTKKSIKNTRIKDGFSIVLIIGVGICAALAMTELTYVVFNAAFAHAIFVGGLLLCAIYPAMEWRYRKTQQQLKSLNFLQKEQLSVYEDCFAKLQRELNYLNTEIAKGIKKKLRHLEVQAEWAGEVKSEKQLFHSSVRFLQGKLEQSKPAVNATSHYIDAIL